jgi:MFS family permease
VAAAVGVRLFVHFERNAAAPLLPLHWLRTRNIALPIASQSLANFAYMGGFLFAPRLLENVLHLHKTAIGNVIITRPLTFAVVAPLAGLATLRVGERVTAVFGSICVGLSMLVFATVAEGSSLLVVILALALSGIGVGVSSPALTSLVANAVDDANMGVAGAMQQLAVQMGAVLGSVVMTAVQAANESSGLVGSYAVAFRVSMVVAAVAAIAACFVRRTPRG